MNPEDLLRLTVLITDTYTFIKKLTSASESRDQRIRKSKDYSRHVQEFGYSDQYAGVSGGGRDDIGDEGEGNYENEDDFDDEDEDDQFYDGADELFAEGGPTESWKLEEKSAKKKKAKKKKSRRHSDKFKVPDLVTMRKRVVIHDRVTQLCALRCNKMKGFLQGLSTPGKFVFIDPLWMSRLLEAFSVCEDWATLLKSSRSFRA